MDLFEYMREQQKETEAPLASRLRPTTLDEMVGQQHIIGKDKLLYRAIKADKLSSIILYGPPGTGKTTLAKVIAHTTSAEFLQINATSAGKKDMEEVIAQAKNNQGMYGRKTILFIDEIHRFNKGQQDYLLPFVEDGTIILIGATTENPYFEVNGALLSRSIIFELKSLSKEDNQWANVMRWEMRTRLFLRTAEFLWQEGHTAHATREEAEAEAQKMLHVYGDFAEKYMAVPVIKGVKSANERFAGALDTYTIEGLMQDGKALQCGTSHFLGQNFAKAFNVQFVDKNNKLDYVWATSWGVSTRLMGALIMTHSDDNGLVLPPHLAPIQVVIVPIYKNDEMLKKIDAKVEGIVNKLKAMGISVKYDNADNKRPGFKFADYELKGVPVRLVMGGRDLENNTMEVMRRDTLEKETRSCDGIEEYVQQLLEDIQNNIYQKALNYRNEHIVKVDSYDDFKEQIEKGGFILAHWDGTPETEDRIKEETKATIRCLPFDADEESLTPGKCMVTGKPSARRVLFARAY